MADYNADRMGIKDQLRREREAKERLKPKPPPRAPEVRAGGKVEDLVEEYEKQENSFFCLACRTYIDLRAPRNERPPCPYGVGYSNQHTFEPSRPTFLEDPIPLSEGRHVRVYGDKSISHPAEGCTNFPKCLDDLDDDLEGVSSQDAKEVPFEEKEQEMKPQRPPYYEGDVFFDGQCLVELSEDVPPHFRYTVDAECETCDKTHVIPVTELGRRWRKESRVKMKTRKFVVTYEMMVKILEEADHLPRGSQILSVHNDHNRDMITFRVHSEAFDNEVVPEGGEYRQYWQN